MDDKLFDLMTKMYNEMQGMKSDIQGMKSDMERLESKVDTLSNQFIQFENNMTRKVDALFDAREAGIDKETEISTGLQRVESKVDKLELKVLRHNLVQCQ